MVLTKFIVHFASKQSNQHSSLSLSQNVEKLVRKLKFELETIDNFSSNFVRNLWIWRTFSLLKFWSSESETNCAIDMWLQGLHTSHTIVIGKYIIKISYLLITPHIPTFSFFQFTSSNGALKLIWPSFYQICTIRMEHITVHDVLEVRKYTG